MSPLTENFLPMWQRGSQRDLKHEEDPNSAAGLKMEVAS